MSRSPSPRRAPRPSPRLRSAPGFVGVRRGRCPRHRHPVGPRRPVLGGEPPPRWPVSPHSAEMAARTCRLATGVPSPAPTPRTRSLSAAPSRSPRRGRLLPRSSASPDRTPPSPLRSQGPQAGVGPITSAWSVHRRGRPRYRDRRANSCSIANPTTNLGTHCWHSSAVVPCSLGLMSSVALPGAKTRSRCPGDSHDAALRRAPTTSQRLGTTL